MTVAAIAAAVGAAGALAGGTAGLISASRGSQTAAANNRSQWVNYLLQREQMEDQRAQYRNQVGQQRVLNQNVINNSALQRDQAADQRELSRAGTLNNRGDATVYVPGIGWVERPSAGTAARLGAADNEELQRNTVDAQRSRLIRGNNFNRQLDEGALADGALANRDIGAQSPREVRSALATAGVANSMAGNNDLRGSAGLQAVRQGTGAQQLLATLGRRGRVDTNAAFANAAVNAPGEYQARTQQREGNAANLYNLFATRASQSQDMPMAVPGISTMNVQRPSGASPLNTSGAGVTASQQPMTLRAPVFQSEESRVPVALAGLGQNISSLGNNKQLQSLFDSVFSRNRGDTYNGPSGNEAYVRTDATGEW